jgi:hypothetical protein
VTTASEGRQIALEPFDGAAAVSSSCCASGALLVAAAIHLEWPGIVEVQVHEPAGQFAVALVDEAAVVAEGLVIQVVSE